MNKANHPWRSGYPDRIRAYEAQVLTDEMLLDVPYLRELFQQMPVIEDTVRNQEEA